jgi:dolichol-phosphate mannosyltransferase
MNPIRLVIAIPTYNERKNAPLLYQEIKDLGIDSDILFIDDNSPDGTGAVVDELAAKDNHVKVMHRPGKMGLGTAHKAAYIYARDHGYSHLIIMDADFTHDPKYIPEMLKLKDKADIVIGSRYTQGGKMHGWSNFRLPFTYFWRWMIKTFLGLPYDSTGAFRLYNVQLFTPELLKQLDATGFAFCMESLYRFSQNKARIMEVPIQARSRIHGESKLSGKIMREAFVQFLKLSFDRLKRAIS